MVYINISHEKKKLLLLVTTMDNRGCDHRFGYKFGINIPEK